MFPKFCLNEDESGDVTVVFKDTMTSEAHDYVCSELERFVPLMKSEERNLYHLENVINSIFSGAAISGRLKSNGKVWNIIGR